MILLLHCLQWIPMARGDSPHERNAIGSVSNFGSSCRWHGKLAHLFKSVIDNFVNSGQIQLEKTSYSLTALSHTRNNDTSIFSGYWTLCLTRWWNRCFWCVWAFRNKLALERLPLGQKQQVGMLWWLWFLAACLVIAILSSLWMSTLALSLFILSETNLARVSFKHSKNTQCGSSIAWAGMSGHRQRWWIQESMISRVLPESWHPLAVHNSVLTSRSSWISPTWGYSSDSIHSQLLFYYCTRDGQDASRHVLQQSFSLRWTASLRLLLVCLN
jgi:hypothetical protein